MTALAAPVSLPRGELGTIGDGNVERRMLDTTMGPAPALVESTARGELPPDVLEAGVRRLGLVTLVWSSSLAVVLVLLTVLAQRDGALREQVLPLAARCLIPAIVLNVAMLLTARSRKLAPRAVLHVSLIYLVFFSLALSALRHGLSWPVTEVLRSWSPVAIVLVTYGALVPARPSTVASASVVAALMDPLALFMAQRAGERPSLAQALVLMLSPAAGAGLAYLSSRVLYGLTEHITRAREVGSYRLQKRLGVGGMGEVWAAKHRMLARPAAIKLIRPAILASHGPEEAKRLLKLFEREAQATASLTSPNTIQLFDYGVTMDGTFYYVMELLDGYDLQTLVKEFGRQPPERVVHLLIQATNSLHEAHELEFVHRDLKPANIFTCRYGGELDFAKVLDFGLVMDRRPTEEELQKPGLIGTPAVMAPEMVRFNAPVDRRADIYALGCVGYWLLTGERVFEAENRADMLVMHAHQRPVPPSKRAGISIPPRLEEILLRCLDKNPNKRPQTALELGDNLRELGLDQEWTRARRQQWWLEHGRDHAAVTKREDESSAHMRIAPHPEPLERSPSGKGSQNGLPASQR
jgi:eukaryotic-like serine/threonine-protein kinase